MRLPISILTLAVAVLALLPPPSASAGSYEVTACVGAENASWRPFKSAPGVVAYASCPGGIDAARGVAGEGLVVRNVMRPGLAAPGAAAGWRFDAPAGTTDHRRRVRRARAAQPGLAGRAAGRRRRPLAVVRRCVLHVGRALGPRRGPGPLDLPAGDARPLRRVVTAGVSGCARSSGSATCASCSTTRRRRSLGRSPACVTAGCAGGSASPPTPGMRPASAPSASTSTVAPSMRSPAPATSPGRCRAPAARSARRSTRGRGPTACTGSGPGWPTPAGPGPGASVSCASTTRRRPRPWSRWTAAPRWSSARARTLRVALPGGQAAPVVRARLTVCRAGRCAAPVVRTIGARGAVAIGDLPGPGEYAIRVALEDAAGNIGPAAPPVTLRFDDTVPGRARPLGRRRLAARRRAAGDPGDRRGAAVRHRGLPRRRQGGRVAAAARRHARGHDADRGPHDLRRRRRLHRGAHARPHRSHGAHGRRVRRPGR